MESLVDLVELGRPGGVRGLHRVEAAVRIPPAFFLPQGLQKCVNFFLFELLVGLQELFVKGLQHFYFGVED